MNDGTPAATLAPSRGGGLHAVIRRIEVYAELSKARLCAMVVMTAGVGFVLAGPREVDWWLLGWTLLGTSLAALGANALNQWREADLDARMERTRTRPLPARLISRREAALVGGAGAAAGPLVLLLAATPLAALLAVVCVLLYVLVYTPLKTRTTLNTAVGAVCGAIPPMIGWAACRGELGAGAWILGAILFIWQIPHFLALAWMYREDYRRAGFRMLPLIDADGRLTADAALLHSLALVPTTLALFLAGLAGAYYAAGALVLGLLMAALARRLRARRDATRARALFLASIVYLPLLLALSVVDRPQRDSGRPVAIHAAAEAPLQTSPPRSP